MQPAKLALGLLLVGLPMTVAHANPEDAVSTTAKRHILPLMPSAADAHRQGFARIINRSDRAGTVSIHATDDAGQRFGPVQLALKALAVAHFDAGDLECGSAAKGLTGGTGAGEGDWRLELTSDLDIQPLAYLYAPDGSVTRIDDATTVADHGQCEIAFFNPASDVAAASRLRLSNTGNADAQVTISGLDDQGAPAAGDVGLTLPPGESRTVSAEALESGGDGLHGRLGAGTGRWRLTVSADEPVAVMNLLESTAGHLTIPSTCETTKRAGRPTGNVVVNADGAAGVARWGTDPYELSAASISGDTLSVTVSYGGGCATHAFTLVLDNAFRMMEPVRLPATLAHDADGDACEAWLTEEHHFDLSPVKTMYQQGGGEHGTVVLLLDNAPDPELTYTF